MSEDIRSSFEFRMVRWCLGSVLALFAALILMIGYYAERDNEADAVVFEKVMGITREEWHDQQDARGR